MSNQLRLLDQNGSASPKEWRLDERTKQVGREGIAAAREALKASRTRYHSPDTQAA